MPLTPQDVREKTFTATRLKVGYSEDEVDSFLDEVEAELTRLYAENAELRARLAVNNLSGAAGAPVRPARDEKGNPFAIELRKSRKEQAPAAAAHPLDGDVAEAELVEEPSAPTPTAPAPMPAVAATSATSAPSAQALASMPVTDETLLTRTLVLAQKTADDVVMQAREESARLVAEAMERAVALEKQAQIEHQAQLVELGQSKIGLEAEVERLRSFEREYRTRLKAYLEMQLNELGSSPAPSLPSADEELDEE